MASGREPVRNDTAAPPRRSAMGRPLLEGFRVGRGAGSVAGRGAGRLPHALGDDADLLDAGALGRIDDGDDLAVAQRAGADDEHRLLLALLEDVAQPRLELGHRHVLLVDRDAAVGRELEHEDAPWKFFLIFFLSGAVSAFLVGRVADTADVYAAADVFALSSYLEGFGLVYIEAALHGVPSIGAAVGAVPETIRDGETGLLVPPGDRAALAGAIGRLRDALAGCETVGEV
ncbi:MAG: glycosyltransferase, partial [Firmicutes bacterium]|nr:glycosyltransferase [Bacillota bacterium]